jgi:hypothetical protein
MTFLVHAIVGLVFGVAYLLFPETVADMLNINLQGGDPYVRFIGAAILGYAASSWLGYMAEEWLEVKIIVQAEIPWMLLAAVLSLWFVIDGTLTAMMWVSFIITALFFVAFAFFYWQEETMPVPKPA